MRLFGIVLGSGLQEEGKTCLILQKPGLLKMKRFWCCVIAFFIPNIGHNHRLDMALRFDSKLTARCVNRSVMKKMSGR